MTTLQRACLSFAAVGSLLAAAAVTTPERADACSPPPPLTIIDQEPLFEVPPDGPVPIYVYLFAVDLIVEVTDSDGAVIDGSFVTDGRNVGTPFESLDGRVIWTPTEPLAPETTYTMTLIDAFESWTESIEFTTATATTAPPSATFDIDELAFAEFYYMSTQTCCGEPEVDSCGTEYPTDCYTTAYDNAYSLTATLVPQELDMRYATASASVDAPGATVTVTPQSSGVRVRARFADLLPENCVTLTMTSLLDGQERVEELCLADSAAILDTDERQTYDPNICSEVVEPECIVDPASCEPEPEPATGCAATHPATGAVWLLALLFAALGWRRRRLQVDHLGT